MAEEEFAEYLRWREAERSRVRSPSSPPATRTKAVPAPLTAPPMEPVEA